MRELDSEPGGSVQKEKIHNATANAAATYKVTNLDDKVLALTQF